uniref:Protein-cysteine N-palmitoyltransferase Rasp n=1 Tax=Parastrongyloides trichosuri TaxID=131310 RepID=A0A0N4ZES6_PARTI
MSTVNQKRVRKPLFNYPPLPEIKLCYLVTFSSLVYAWYHVYLASSKYNFKIGQPAVMSNLPFFGNRIKDISNWEWNMWSSFAIKYLPYLLIHSLIFNIFPKIFPINLWKKLYTIVSIFLSIFIFTPSLVLISILQGIFIFITTKYVPKKLTVWLSSLPILYLTMNNPSFLCDNVFYVLIFCSYTLLSYISFNLEYLNNDVNLINMNDFEKIFEMFFYTFYQPYMFSLIVIYPDFAKQISDRELFGNQRDWKGIISKSLRLIFWVCLLEFVLHFFYFEIMLNDNNFIYQLPKNEFVPLGMAMGAFFHLKYVIIFGLPSLFATIDGMKPLDGPICISRIVLYSKIWRGFDRGLYIFFKKYIFIPICEPTFSLGRKIFGLCVSYLFVLLWHGFLHHNIIWIVLNILELLLEYTAKGIYTIDSVKTWRERNISDVNFRRILGWLQIVPFVFGLYSNFYFLGGSHVGWAYVDRIFWQETVTLQYPFFILIGLGWFYVNVTMEIDRKMELKNKKD